MITGLPDYITPIEQSIRCVCNRRYLVFFGGGMGDAEARAKERAVMLKAQFVDAQFQPWLVCSCDQVLDFVSDLTVLI